MFSPRSSNYDRLEGGMGPSKNGTGRRFAWKKFAIGAVVIVGLVYFFGPRREDLDDYMPSIISDSKVDFEPPPGYPAPTAATGHITTHTPILPPHEDDIVPSARPTDPASDGDLTKTHYCTKPYTPGVPLVQFALMIDAGSTGSRIHIYKFNNCGPSPAYEYEVFKQRQPGLSKYAGDPSAAAESLDELLDEAVRVVPEALRKCTPVAVKATAGLRLLGTQESAAILAAVRARIEARYPFVLHGGEDAVVIMDGRDEGVYAWITANYLLDTIRAGSPAANQPYAVLDLGGASTQIVFEPTFDMKKPDATLEEGEHKYDLQFGGRKRVLYQHSYLGYGLMKARASVHRVVEFMGGLLGKGHGKDATIANPCLAKGTERRVEITDERLGDQWNVTMTGADVGSFEACNRVVELVMAKDAICEVKPCSFNGVYQPSLLETFPHGKILLLSYFYDRLNPFLAATVNPVTPPVHVSMFGELAKTVCEGPAAWRKRWGADSALMKELEGRPEYCLDLTFMHALLRLGYEFGGDREVEVGKQIDGTELGWCLGATIAMVTGAELKCRV
ncbi:nucleoside phosphatase family-domain-containing protein [Trametes maxima]|nr:nucleoside phosphatase family-domain-containing protein [Trametes maxima]